MATGNTLDLGRLAGPMQVTNARSIDRIFPIEHSITRVTPTKIDATKRTEMGGKWIVPYGLYRAFIHYSAPLGTKTGVTAEDLDVFYRAVAMMFEHTRSASRSTMAVHGLWVFTHADRFGRAPAHLLERRIRINHRNPNDTTAPRSIDDYQAEVDTSALPDGVSLDAVIPFTASDASLAQAS
jgi:CRISPR-associated protein Csd2